MSDRRSFESARLSHARDVRLGSLCSLVLPALSFGCVETRDWAVVEITEFEGVRIHERGESYYVVGGHPREANHDWAKQGQRPVRWVLDPHGAMARYDRSRPVWPRVLSGDLSPHGLLAVARCTRQGPRPYAATEIYRLADGELVASLDNHPLAVAWSHDGTTLAILEIGGDGREEDPEQFSLWQEGRGTIARWVRVPELMATFFRIFWPLLPKSDD